MSPERLSKKQIKQDNFITSAFKASEYIQKNRTLFLGGFAGLIAIILIISFFNYSADKKVLEAENLFGKAQLASAMGQQSLAINDYRSLLEQYGSAPIADRGCYYLARTYYDRQEQDSALVYYEKYINEYGNEPLLLGAAYAGAAECYEASGDLPKTADYFMKAGQAADSEFASPGYYMSAGRVYREAGMMTEANAAYQAVIDNYPRSQHTSLAKKLQAEVEYAAGN